MTSIRAVAALIGAAKARTKGGLPVRVLIHPRSLMATDTELRTRIGEALSSALGPVESHLDGADVFLTDVNGPRSGPDKRCRVVARLPAGGSVVVCRTARDPVTAVTVAALRCRRAIRSRLKKRQDGRRRAAVR
jgi:putative sigma-54 modulation protein